MTTVAFFGATGGCANACLTYTLLDGYNARALARTPSKLTTMLLSQPGMTPEIISRQLEIIEGDATDVDSILKTLITNSNPQNAPNGTCTLVTSIISGLGGTPAISFTKEAKCAKTQLRMPALPHIQLSNPHITEQTTSALLGALAKIASTRFDSFEAYRAVAPRVTVISTTGNLPGNKDVPFWFRPMYSVLLPIPHADKLQMERLLEKEIGLGDAGVLAAGVVVVRPSLLTGEHQVHVHEAGEGGEGVGLEKVRVGTTKAPAIGYTISRALVGEWIFKEIVKGGGGKWVGEKVTITT
ncbi:NAD(P)-binding domain [Penicillium digitatum]|uniref:NAD(P)-binding domain-containing protein n=3 Tax=Penicillium digitatum TaxID=36651 RepID=K9FY62_PEND2|nr:hypothetical protein PDIP_50860 [Penicillium digitatum Pd1]EKV12901.1 hypothetical protein PDIP_50860 [Penicillium digitatum Pd1]EKV14675.1 hypothetical protein PDIG_31280 [Penicillium digitatum PHI26]QQK43357.1 NAD(P)-binding domain [Penicillium digitatum]